MKLKWASNENRSQTNCLSTWSLHHWTCVYIHDCYKSLPWVVMPGLHESGPFQGSYGQLRERTQHLGPIWATFGLLIQISLRSSTILYFSADRLNCASFLHWNVHISLWFNPKGHSKFHTNSNHPYSLPPPFFSCLGQRTCARGRRTLQQLALNVHVKHSDLTWPLNYDLKSSRKHLSLWPDWKLTLLRVVFIIFYDFGQAKVGHLADIVLPNQNISRCQITMNGFMALQIGHATCNLKHNMCHDISNKQWNTHTHKHIDIHTHKHIYIYTHTYTYTQTYRYIHMQSTTHTIHAYIQIFICPMRKYKQNTHAQI